MKNQNKIVKIASSGSKEGILKLLIEYFYLNEGVINHETGECFNAKGKMKCKCMYVKGRYILYYPE